MEVSVFSVVLVSVFLLAVSMPALSSTFCSDVRFVLEFWTDSSADSGFVDTPCGDDDVPGDIIAGEFRCCCCCCCSNSYSLSKRFLSGCALFDETDVVGETDDDIGDVAIGGVLLLVLDCVRFTVGLFRFDDTSLCISDVDSWGASAGDKSA